MAFRVLTVAAILFGWTLPAGAQQSVTLEFSAGKVTLNAQNAPVRAILAEWARLGGATIVNGDRVVGPPVTLQLTSVSERQALDVVLRGVSGYMAAPRAAGSSGASVFDRIVILPVSVAPRNPPPAAAGAGRPGPQRPRERRSHGGPVTDTHVMDPLKMSYLCSFSFFFFETGSYVCCIVSSYTPHSIATLFAAYTLCSNIRAFSFFKLLLYQAVIPCLSSGTHQVQA
jgi:hypothetical protein